MKYIFKEVVIDEDLFNLTIKYHKEEIKDYKEAAKIAIENSRSDIPELFNETREYPPFIYYIILSMMNRKKIYEKWSSAEKSRKDELVKECYRWLEELASEIREPGDIELKTLGEKSYIKID